MGSLEGSSIGVGLSISERTKVDWYVSPEIIELRSSNRSFERESFVINKTMNVTKLRLIRVIYDVFR